MYTFRDIVLAYLQKPVLLACDAELFMILIGWDFLLNSTLNMTLAAADFYSESSKTH